MTDSQLNAAQRATPAGTPRARALGIPSGGTPGQWNAITDVPGVEVGYQTIIRGETARTGVTGIYPSGRGGAIDPLAAGYIPAERERGNDRRGLDRGPWTRRAPGRTLGLQNGGCEAP